MLVYRTRSGNGSVLAFYEAVFDGQHSRRDVGPRTDAIGLRAGARAADLIGSCASGRLGRPLGGPGSPRGPGKVDFERFLAVEGYARPRRVLQQGPRGVPTKISGLGFIPLHLRGRAR